MTTNHQASNETAATVVRPSLPADEVNTNLEDYAQQVELPPYAAPVEPSFSFPLVQYAKGVVVVSGRRPQKHTGFLIETEQSAEVDGLFEGQGMPTVRVRHRNGTEGVYWQLETLKSYILCKAVPDGYGPDVWERTGIAYVWNPYRDTYLFGSQLQCLLFSQGLLQLGYTQPLVLTLSRTVTTHFVNRVLRRHEAMINAIKKALKKHNKPDGIGFYGYWMELVKGEEVTVKNGGSYFAPAIAMPSPLTVGYVREHQTPADHQAIIESFLPVLPQWAQEASARLVRPPREINDSVTQEEPEPLEEVPEPED
jgi:hypothetical protein